MLKAVVVLVFVGSTDSQPIAVAAYDSWGDCHEIADSIRADLQPGAEVYCEKVES